MKRYRWRRGCGLALAAMVVSMSACGTAGAGNTAESGTAGAASTAESGAAGTGTTDASGAGNTAESGAGAGTSADAAAAGGAAGTGITDANGAAAADAAGAATASTATAGAADSGAAGTETSGADTTGADAAGTADSGAAGTDASSAGNTAESASSANGGESTTGAASPAELYAQIAASVALPEMWLADDGYAQNYLGLELSSVESYVFAIADDVTRVDSVILVAAADTAGADAAERALGAYLAQKAEETDPAGGGYQTELHGDIAASSVGRSGRYVWLAVSPDRAAIEGVIAGAWR